MSRSLIVRHSILGITVIAAVLLSAMWQPIPQPSTYHLFADTRSFLGIPNCLNVLSNLPFAIVGVLGLIATFSRKVSHTARFSDPWERWPYAALFAGVALTSLGSGYYHLTPDNAGLVWDRLPMSIAFMGLLSALLAERVSLSISRWLFAPLLVVGAASVGYWYWTEGHNAGDLRFYLLVQFGSLLLVVLLLVLYPARYRGTGYLAVGLAAYAAAKGFEMADREVFALGQIVSGHTLKHLIAAGGVAFLIGMLRARTRRDD
ncbi:MAG: ceramidase domain-containing protein [Acidobacteria bacterium]|nr:ceramidase domain-containing protein [Acidobacteriota bacterium]